MNKRRGPRPLGVRTLDVPLPPEASLEDSLASKLRSRDAARRAVADVAAEFGLEPGDAPNVAAAIALTKLGGDLQRIARSLDWEEFEEYCAGAISAAGYSVRRNVRLRKPTRQIDIVAESPSLVLCADCKHWSRGVGAGGLDAVARAQAERTKMYAARSKARGRAFLPMLVTMLDNQVRVVGGVPVVPLQSLRGFLASVSPFDEGLAFVGPRER